MVVERHQTNICFASGLGERGKRYPEASRLANSERGVQLPRYLTMRDVPIRRALQWALQDVRERKGSDAREFLDLAILNLGPRLVDLLNDGSDASLRVVLRCHQQLFAAQSRLICDETRRRMRMIDRWLKSRLRHTEHGSSQCIDDAVSTAGTTVRRAVA
jgi:hypothetical protein